MKKLFDDQKLFFESEITKEECGKTLQMLSNNKTPGCAGLSTDHKFF